MNKGDGVTNQFNVPAVDGNIKIWIDLPGCAPFPSTVVPRPLLWEPPAWTIWFTIKTAEPQSVTDITLWLLQFYVALKPNDVVITHFTASVKCDWPYYQFLPFNTELFSKYFHFLWTKYVFFWKAYLQETKINKTEKIRILSVRQTVFVLVLLFFYFPLNAHNHFWPERVRRTI